MTRIAFVLDSSSATSVRDGIEAALAALAFEHRVSVLVQGSALAWLSPVAQPKMHGIPDIARGLAALAHHGAEDIVLDAVALRSLGIAVDDQNLRPLEPDSLGPWLAHHDHVFHF